MTKNHVHNTTKNHVHNLWTLFMDILYGHGVFIIFNRRKTIILLMEDIFKYSIVRVSMDMDCPCPLDYNIGYFGGYYGI